MKSARIHGNGKNVINGDAVRVEVERVEVERVEVEVVEAVSFGARGAVGAASCRVSPSVRVVVV